MLHMRGRVTAGVDHIQDEQCAAGVGLVDADRTAAVKLPRSDAAAQEQSLQPSDTAHPLQLRVTLSVLYRLMCEKLVTGGLASIWA